MKHFSTRYPLIVSCLFMLVMIPAYSQYNVISRVGPDAGVTSLSGDATGNYYVAGTFSGTSFTIGGLPLQATNNKGAAFVIKMDANKNWLWAKTINRGNASVDIRDIATDNGGNIYVAGWFTGTVNFGNLSLTSNQSASASNYDLFVAKMNSSGTFIWAKKDGTKNGSDVATAVAVDGSGNVIITGHATRKTIQQGEITDIYLAKYNNSGTALWTKKYSNRVSSGSGLSNMAGDLKGNDVTVDAAGNIYTTGVYKGNMRFGSLSASASTLAAYTLKLNSNGVEEWVRTANSNSWDKGSSVLVDNSGYIYSCGVYEGTSVSIGTTSLSGSKNFMAKYSFAGNLHWAANINSPVIINATLYPDIAAFTCPNGNIGVVKGEYGILELSPSDGSLMTSHEFIGWGSTGYAEVNKVASISNGYMFAGSVLASVDFENASLYSECDINTGCEQVDMFIIDYTSALQKQNPVVQISLSPYIKVYPNPVSDRLFVSATEKLEWIKIIDLAGRELQTVKPMQQQVEINISHLAAGTYLIMTNMHKAPYKIQKL